MCVSVVSPRCLAHCFCATHRILRNSLINAKVGCALRTHAQMLPKWGWEQYEVSCNPEIDDPDNLWNIELHQNHLSASGGGVGLAASVAVVVFSA